MELLYQQGRNQLGSFKGNSWMEQGSRGVMDVRLDGDPVVVSDLATRRATVQSTVSLPGARVGSRPGAGGRMTVLS